MTITRFFYIWVISINSCSNNAYFYNYEIRPSERWQHFEIFLYFSPADRTGEDLDIIYSRLKDLKAFEKFHPMLLQQICYYSYYEELEQGVICKYQ